jgi:hypothetical protein
MKARLDPRIVAISVHRCAAGAHLDSGAGADATTA